VNAVAAARSADRLCVPTAAVKHDEVAAVFVKKCDVLAHARMPCASVNMNQRHNASRVSAENRSWAKEPADIPSHG
jgi:hypothetical protein